MQYDSGGAVTLIVCDVFSTISFLKMTTQGNNTLVTYWYGQVLNQVKYQIDSAAIINKFLRL